MRRDQHLLAQMTIAAGAAAAREIARLLPKPAPLASPSGRVPVNRGTDATSTRVYGLIFEALARGTVLPLAARQRATAEVYEHLVANGVAFRVESGLDRLRRVSDEVHRDQEGGPTHA